ncbi:MAG: DUF2892 domain-containing protein [Myxococcota bacterium]|nr:DUF2892 domain-containing protein [Myxococcota bacterium]
MDHLDLREPDRLRNRTTRKVRDKIDARLEEEVRLATAGGEEALRDRLGKLDAEWDLDRALMASLAVLGALGFRRGKGWRYLLGTQISFLLLHSLVGWCPPFEVFRRLGFRSAREIEAERHELLTRLERATRASTHHL